VALRHAVDRGVLAVARILGDVVDAHRSFAGESRREHLGVAWHAELRERLARRAAERVEEVGLAGLVRHVVEERAELRSRELGRRAGPRLHRLLEVELRGERLADAVQRLERARLLA